MAHRSRPYGQVGAPAKAPTKRYQPAKAGRASAADLAKGPRAVSGPGVQARGHDTPNQASIKPTLTRGGRLLVSAKLSTCIGGARRSKGQSAHMGNAVPEFLRIVSALREQMNATLARSDALRPLSWLIGLLGLSTLGAVYAKSPDWILGLMGAAFALAILLYAFAYLWCLFRDPDALRSEKYSLNKMAIQHGLLGDSQAGVFDPNDQKSQPGTPIQIIEQKP